jgi:hypothetical protein
MFTNRRTIPQAIAGAVAVAALSLAALTGATPAAHAAALTPGANAATVAAPHALSSVPRPADQGWSLYTTYPGWDFVDCYATGEVGLALGLWSNYGCLPTWNGVQLWVYVDNAY